LKKDGVLLYDDELVQLDEKSSGVKKAGIPATKIAEELGNRVVANIVMLGFLVGATGVISHEALEKGVADSVPKKFLDLNIRAFRRGYEFAGAASAGEVHG
jgi:2-oxoglutarate ferredoxin oxidoreductase subunit gamma